MARYEKKKKRKVKKTPQGNSPAQTEKRKNTSGIMEIKPRPARERKELSEEEKRVTLEVMEKDRIRRYNFASEEDKEMWKKMSKKRKLYTPYFLLGVGINLLLYKAGLDLSRDLILGPVVGIGVPMLTMFALAELHYRVFMLPKEENNS